MRPDGKRLFVANQSSETVSVIDTNADRVVATIQQVGSKPHGIAITADGSKVYITQFLAVRRAGDTRPLTQTEGADDGREGRVTVINGHSNQVLGAIALAPIAVTGFLSDGNTLAREPLTPAPGPPMFDNVTGAFPNLLESIVVREQTPTFRARARRRTVHSGSTSTCRAACRRSTSPRTSKSSRRSR